MAAQQADGLHRRARAGAGPGGGRRSRGAWHRLARRPLPQDEGQDRGRGAGRAGAGAARPLGRPPHRGRRAATTSGSPRASATARTGSGRWTSTAASSRGRLSEIAGAGGPAGRPADADPRASGGSPSARRRARPRAARRSSSASAPGSTPPPRAPRRCPSRCSSCASGLRALAPGRHPQPRQAARLRPLAPTGSASCCAPTWSGSWARSWPPPRPGLSRSTTRSSTQEPWSGDGLPLVEQIDAVRRALGLADRGERLQQLGRLRRALSATGSPLIAGDPHLPPSMPGIWYQVEPAARRPLRPRRLAARACPASTWARTTTSAGPSPT